MTSSNYINYGVALIIIGTVLFVGALIIMFVVLKKHSEEK